MPGRHSAARTPRSGERRHGQPRQPLRRRIGAGTLALTFAATMAVSTSIPAQSLISAADLNAAAQPRAPRPTEPPQSLQVSYQSQAAPVSRDGFTATSEVALAAAKALVLEKTEAAAKAVAVEQWGAKAGSTAQARLIAVTADLTAVADTIQWPLPAGTRLNDHFGPRNCTGCSSNHRGQDFNPGFGAPVFAIAAGVVSYVEDGDRSLGVHIIIDHVIDGEKISSVYAHLIHGSALVKAGDAIAVGQVIGSTGTTGMSTGPHLHFEIRPGGRYGGRVDPYAWLVTHATAAPAPIPVKDWNYGPKK